MAAEIDRIVDQLQRGLDGEAWHGRSLKGILKGVNGAAGGPTSVPIEASSLPSEARIQFV